MRELLKEERGLSRPLVEKPEVSDKTCFQADIARSLFSADPACVTRSPSAEES